MCLEVFYHFKTATNAEIDVDQTFLEMGFDTFHLHTIKTVWKKIAPELWVCIKTSAI